MGIEVVSSSWECVRLRAPLAPNINHRETVFGGSASAICILAAWSLVHLRLGVDGLRTRLVIQRNTMDYESPVTGEFEAASSIEDGQPAWIGL